VDESFLEALLHDVFCIFSDAGEASRNGENPLVVTPDQNFKCLSISTLGGNDKCRVFILARGLLSWRIRKLA
jgi:hypothetical protein